MTEIEAGGPAFPVIYKPGDQVVRIGMTLRDYFAAAALTGINAGFTGGYPDPTHASKEAYMQADAMLKARDK